MPIFEIVQYSSKEGPSLEQLVQFAKEANGPTNLVVGKDIKDNTEFQLVVEWGNVTDYQAVVALESYETFTKSLTAACGPPREVLRGASSKSIFGSEGAATSDVLEFARTQFPVARVTAGFEKQLQDDFDKFDDIFKKEAAGGSNWTSGWVLGKQDTVEGADGGGAPSRSFFVLRGYNSEEEFVKSIQTESFKKSIPILLGWNGNSNMVSLFANTCFSVQLTILKSSVILRNNFPSRQVP